MKKEEKKFVTEYQINGKKYAGEIWATSWEEAECFIKQRASTEKAVGLFLKINHLYHIQKTDIMATKKQILESDELLQQKRRAYYLSDEGFEEYKKFLSDPDQKKFCFKGYYYVEVKEQDDKELLGAMGRVVYE